MSGAVATPQVPSRPASFLRRLDDGVARGEAAICATLLVTMVVCAALQAVLRNLAQAGVGPAATALTHFGWIDDFLQLGTVWVAFLGASLATHADKHIAIDVLSKIFPPRARTAVSGLTGVFVAFVAVVLAVAFYRAIIDQPTDADFAVFEGLRSVHICDASVRALHEAHVPRPTMLCGARWVLGFLHVPIGRMQNDELRAGSTQAVFQLVVPVMFLFIAVRSFGRGAGRVIASIRGIPQPEQGESPPSKVPPSSDPMTPAAARADDTEPTPDRSAKAKSRKKKK